MLLCHQADRTLTPWPSLSLLESLAQQGSLLWPLTMPAVAWNLVAVLSFTGKSRRWIELKKDWLNTGVGKLP